jgi:hypothetical protein
MARTPAHVRRAELVADSSRELGRALVEHDVQQRELAEATARAADKVQRVCDPSCRETLSIVDVRMAELVAQSGALAAHFAGACADGRLCPDEARAGIAHCRSLAETIAALEHRLQTTLEDRGDKVRRLND